MNKRLLSSIVALLLLTAACQREARYARDNAGNASQKKETAQARPSADPHEGHSHGEPGRVPAFESDPKNLPPTLDPSAFAGKTRQAYAAVREIPATIAQLPCYCNCDRTVGHKSLHSCFVDGHASSCAVCVEEALMAYSLEKREKLTPAQIRERIIEVYSKL